MRSTHELETSLSVPFITLSHVIIVLTTASAPPQLPPRYQDWSRTTPFITRSIVLSLVISYIISWFLPLTLALSNVPLFTVQSLEVYRVATSVLVCDSIFTLLFSGLAMTSVGSGLEREQG